MSELNNHTITQGQPGFCSDGVSCAGHSPPRCYYYGHLNTQMHGSSDLSADIICYLDYIWEREPA